MISFQQLVKTFRLQEQFYPFQVVYSFYGIHCLMGTNQLDQLKWADTYFRPHYQRERYTQMAPTPYCLLRSWVGQSLYEQVALYIQDYLPQQLNNAFEGDVDYIDCEDGSILYYKQKKLFLICDKAFRRVYLISSTQSDDIVYEPARMVRELMTRHLERKGFFLLHAAAVERKGKAILFCGDKSAGKTTMMLGLLAAGYDLIGNDKVYVGIENRRVKVISWPGPVGITMQTVFQHPNLQKLAAKSTQLMFPQRRWDADIYALGDIGIADHEIHKLDLSVGETVAAFKRRFVPQAELDRIIVLGNIPLGKHLQPVQSDRTAMQIIRQHFFFTNDDPNYPASDPSYPNWYGLNNRHKKWIKFYEMTLSIISRLATVYIMSKTRVDPVQWKVGELIRFIENRDH